MLSHAAEDSSLLIYKTSDGKLTRTAYNLHKTHCGLPGAPSSLSVPWVPLDPGLLLPYHVFHGRIPCTFPPKSLEPTAQQKVSSCFFNEIAKYLLLACFTDYEIFNVYSLASPHFTYYSECHSKNFLDGMDKVVCSDKVLVLV